jgi:hypothetical protein
MCVECWWRRHTTIGIVPALGVPCAGDERGSRARRSESQPRRNNGSTAAIIGWSLAVCHRTRPSSQWHVSWRDSLGPPCWLRWVHEAVDPHRRARPSRLAGAAGRAGPSGPPLDPPLRLDAGGGRLPSSSSAQQDPARQRRRMSAGTKRRTPGPALRQGDPSPESAMQECGPSERRTVMRALRQLAGVTREYQSDTSSKPPASSAFSGPSGPGPPGPGQQHGLPGGKQAPRFGLDTGRSISVGGCYRSRHQLASGHHATK